MQGLDGRDDNPWEFDTIRARSSTAAYEDDMHDETVDYDATVRVSGPTTLPSSLRGLFEENDSGLQPFRTPQFAASSRMQATPTLTIPESNPHDDVTIKKPLRPEGRENAMLGKGSFIFPPPTGTPVLGKSREPWDEDQLSSSDNETPPTSSIHSSQGTDSDSPSSSTPRVTPLPTRTTFAGSPDLTFRRRPSEINNSSNELLSSSTPEIRPSSRPILSRKRSQGNFGQQPNLPETLGIGRARSPGTFQFPASPSPKPLVLPLQLRKASAPTSPTKRLLDSPEQTMSHQSTYSLDINRQFPPPTLKESPSISRARSATGIVDSAQAEDYSHTYQTARSPRPNLDFPALAPPLKPFSSRQRNRSDSDGLALVTPGLKDVLKVSYLFTFSLVVA